MNKSVLISGASTGIGKALSLDLDRHGYQVFAGVRNESDAEALQGEASPNLTPVILDVTLAETISTTCELVAQKTDGHLFCLVNNAGISIGGALEFLPVQQFRQQLEVNLVGPLALTQACLPMLRKAAGRVIFVSSVGGRLAMPFNGPYSTSKAALVTMADTLRLELAPWKIYTSVLIVPSVQTAIWQKAARTAGAILRSAPEEARTMYGDQQKRAGSYYRNIGQKGIQVEQVVQAARRLLEQRHPKEYVFVGRYALLTELAVKLLPIRIRDRMVSRWMGLKGP